jgi:hypothetical protein
VRAAMLRRAQHMPSSIPLRLHGDFGREPCYFQIRAVISQRGEVEEGVDADVSPVLVIRDPPRRRADA